MFNIQGRVKSGLGVIAHSTVTLWAAGPGAPVKLAQTQTQDDGSYTLQGSRPSDDSAVLYLIAKGGQPQGGGDHVENPAIALMATLGTVPPQRVTVNEMTTVASVWTAAQFLKADALSGKALGLRIAAGNVPNLVDLATGGLGPVIQDPLNSSQTATLATFNTLSNVLAGCIARIQSDACSQLFAQATPPGGVAPTDTLMATQNIARNPSNHAAQLFALLAAFYPAPAQARWRPVPFIPYLSFAPTAWTLSLVYSGGGINSPGGIAIDAEGNMWANDNFLVGAQSTIHQDFGGGVSKMAPDGKPISPATTGYRGGGIDGPGFGLAIAADDKVWTGSLGGRTISVLDRKTGKPLSPDTGYNFGGRLGSIQGIISTPGSDIWALDNERDQIIHFPQGDASKGQILGRTENDKPVDGTLQVKKPFHLAIDQSDQIWITNSGSNTVTRFAASNPAKAEQITVGYGPRAIAIDSLGNAWLANTFGHPGLMQKMEVVFGKVKAKMEAVFGSPLSPAESAAKMWIAIYELAVKYRGGDVSLVPAKSSTSQTFDGAKSIVGPWGIAIDGNDNVWVANALGRTVTQLCGARPENCPLGAKTGDRISPAGGYFGGLQIITDVAVDPAGNVWVANNWDMPEEGFKKVPEPALSTRFGANSMVVFFGLAKPVKTPLIGPPPAQ